MTVAPPWPIAVALIALSAAPPSAGDDLNDPYFGEALYFAHQGYYFEALQRLDAELGQHYGLDEPELDSLYVYLNDAEFSVGDFELNYRMHHRAGRAIKAVLEGDVDEDVRNDAAYRLARIHFQKGQMTDALHALGRIEGKIPEAIRDDIEFLRANIYMATDRPSDAVDVLKRLQDANDLKGFASYNLGIALLQAGKQQAALKQLDRAGQIGDDDRATDAIRDKSNLVLGTILLEAGEFDQAKHFLDRVSLEGPFSNQALLSSGWADVSVENFERAVVPWSILAQRDVTDGSAQEAMLALPYAYSKLNVHGRAALFYGRALDSFGAELEKLGASIESIREGRFLQALIREEIRQDKDWVIQLRSLPDTPETYYLMELSASHVFQTGLQNYLDLADLRKKLVSWQTSIDSFEDMVEIREGHYEPLLPDIDHQFRKLDSRMRLRVEQRRILERRLKGMLTTPRPEFLATREEQAVLARLKELEGQLGEDNGPVAANLKERMRRLSGTVTWTLLTEYHERLTVFDRNLRELESSVELMRENYARFVRARQAATHGFEGYEAPVRRLRTRIAESLAKIDLLMARQGHLLEVVAIDELVARRRRLENYQDQARFALADSYDRATQAQARGVLQQ
ncbi:MAG: tetratricopeptide repeat protein [Woeseiaceae bacterium]